MGVGSAVDPKILIRVQGPTTSPADDELLEAKMLKDLGNLRCLEERASPPALRVIDGTRQLGRIKLNVLAAGPDLVIPELTARGRKLRDWWIRSWEPSYREVRLEDMRSVKDLAAIAYDAGVQLGAGGLLDYQGPAGRGPDTDAGLGRAARAADSTGDVSPCRATAAWLARAATSPMIAFENRTHNVVDGARWMSRASQR